ncbi:hypothetical protein D4765_13940 [Subtercola vilae]|uniref:PrgI family protein n=1 Tax=Subtercola vilae TaxID=2056433 RepID=A0A4T2BRD6_9MICO|nr:hypothetical protein D4765_13940 [Subtercola vilae]
MPKARAWALSIAGVTSAILVLALQFNGLLVALPIFAVAWLGTMGTENGTILARQLGKWRWRGRIRTGTTVYVPYDSDVWDEWMADAVAARGKERKAANRKLAAMRETPDGVEGMSWLEDRTGQPGIAWHRPLEQEAYLSVAFSTAGQIAGIEGDSFLDACAEAYGALLARNGERAALVGRIQTLTRVLPVDSARHERWVNNNRDSEAPAIVAESYQEVITGLRRGQLFQRHMFTVSWPITPLFINKAKRRGVGRDGWIRLMEDEIRNVASAFRTAKFRSVTVLSARQTAAVIRHMQHPSFPIDQVADVSATSGWVPSEDKWSYTTFSAAAAGPNGPITKSLSRTARIEAKHVETSYRNSLWLVPMLTGMSKQIVRTLSFHLEVIPQAEARYLARQDVVSDLTESATDQQRGRLADEETTVSLSAAKRRRRDLNPGSGIHGVAWVGYVTVSATDEPALIEAVDAIEDAASQAGINKLIWLDTYQAAAHATTWPVGRGLTPARRQGYAQLESLIAGKGAKEQL